MADFRDGPSTELLAIAASGHAAAPPSPAMNSRRRRQMLTWPSLASQWIKPEGAGQQAISDRRPTKGRPPGGRTASLGSPYACDALLAWCPL